MLHLLLVLLVADAEAASAGPTTVKELADRAVAESKAGHHEESARLWTQVITLDPSNGIAHYNLGQHHQRHGDAQLQLKYFLAAAKLMPGDAQSTQKVVQSYFRLGRYADADPYKKKLREMIDSGLDPRPFSKKEFCIDQFDVGDDHFMVWETYDRGPEQMYIYRFKLMGPRTIIKSINLETSPGLRERGTPYVLGQNVGNEHTTFDHFWKAMPEYGKLKEAALAAHAGRLAAGASSRPRN